MRIISFDGGGVRGVLSARIVERLEGMSPGFVRFSDKLAGVSAGSQNAGALAAGMRPEEVVSLFRRMAPDVFRSRDWMDSASLGLDELVRADYDIDRLAAVLKGALGEALTLADLQKRVLITTFCLDNLDPRPEHRHWKAKYIHNYEREGNDGAWPLWAALCASSAAPTYFEAFMAPDGKRYVDGGVIDNSPSMSAVASALKSGATLSELRVVSIGTGSIPHRADGGDWGFKQWLSEKRLLNMLFDGMVGVPDYQVARLLGRFQPGHPDHDPAGRYVRIDPRLPHPVDLADVSQVDDLVSIADDVDLEWLTGWLRGVWGSAEM